MGPRYTSEEARLARLLFISPAGLTRPRESSAPSMRSGLATVLLTIYCHCFRMLLKSGADANLAMADGRTPIHIASEAGNIGVIRLLLENEANILATDEV